MLGKVIKAVLDWLTGLARKEIKKDVEATDVNTPDAVRDDFRAGLRDKLRKHKGSIHPPKQ
jgi:hypothetical protein